MPSVNKILHFMSSALATSISVGVLGFAMTRKWSETTMACSREGSGFFNGTAVIELELFDGALARSSCPSFGFTEPFQVIPKFAELGGAPVVLHVLVLCLLVLCLLCSAISILIALYNSVSNPYETYMGPVGVYTCSSISTCLSVLVLIMFVLNVHVTSMAEDLVADFTGPLQVDLKDKTSVMKLGYFLVIPYTVLSLVAIVLIYLYDHAAYTHRREQQRPTEDTPKEIMMY